MMLDQTVLLEMIKYELNEIERFVQYQSDECRLQHDPAFVETTFTSPKAVEKNMQQILVLFTQVGLVVLGMVQVTLIK